MRRPRSQPLGATRLRCVQVLGALHVYDRRIEAYRREERRREEARRLLEGRGQSEQRFADQRRAEAAWAEAVAREVREGMRLWEVRRRAERASVRAREEEAAEAARGRMAALQRRQLAALARMDERQREACRWEERVTSWLDCGDAGPDSG